MNFEEYCSGQFLIEMPIGKYGEDIYSERIVKYGFDMLIFDALRYNVFKQLEDKFDVQISSKLMTNFDEWFGNEYKEVVADYVGSHSAYEVYDMLFNFLKKYDIKYIDVVTPNIISDYLDYLADNAETGMGGKIVYDMYRRVDDETRKQISMHMTPKYLIGLLKFFKSSKIGFDVNDFDNNTLFENTPLNEKYHITVNVDLFNLKNHGYELQDVIEKI